MGEGTFTYATAGAVFLWFLRNLMHMIYVPICKKTEHIFKILILKSLANFLKS